MKSRLPEGNTIEERLDLIQGKTPMKLFFELNKVVGLETRVAEELKDVPSFRERIGELETDDSIYKKMVSLYNSLPDNLRTLGEIK